MDGWISWAVRSKLKPFVKLAATIRKFKDGVLAYVKTRLTNGLTEGLSPSSRLLSRLSPIALAAALGLSAGACKGGSSESASASPSITSPTAALVKATFAVEGMTCTSCNITVKVAAEKVPGVSEARASHGEKRAWVTYDPAKTTPAAIAMAIANAGYKSTPVQD